MSTRSEDQGGPHGDLFECVDLRPRQWQKTQIRLRTGRSKTKAPSRDHKGGPKQNHVGTRSHSLPRKRTTQLHIQQTPSACSHRTATRHAWSKKRPPKRAEVPQWTQEAAQGAEKVTMQARVLKKTQGAGHPKPESSQQNTHEKVQTIRGIEEEQPRETLETRPCPLTWYQLRH